MVYIKAQRGADQQEVEIGVSFTHNTKELPDGVEGITFCDLTVQGLRVATGNAICVTGDRFNKPTGRKLSLKRALDTFKAQHGLTKELLTRIWNAYFESMK